MSESRVPATIEYATPIEFRRDALIVRSGRAAGLVFIVVGGFLLAFCGFLHWVDAEGPAVSFRNAVLLGTVSVAVGVGCLRHRPVKLVVSDGGFLSMIGNPIEIRWADIAEAVAVPHSDERTYLILRLTDPTAGPQLPWSGPIFERPPQAENEDVVLPISGLDASPELILRQIRSRIAIARGESA
jgi:hypothetical protein